MKTAGWTTSEYDASVFIHSDDMFLTVYVDDLLLFTPTSGHVDKVYKYLSTEFKVTKLENIAYYLEMQVKQSLRRIHIHQANYVHHLLNKYELNKIRPVSTPKVLPKIKASTEKPLFVQFHRKYQSMIKALNYLAVVSHSDITESTSTVSRFLSNSNQKHMTATECIYTYLKKNNALESQYTKVRNILKITEYMDSNWVKCSDTRKSTFEWIFLLTKASIFWLLKR